MGHFHGFDFDFELWQALAKKNNEKSHKATAADLINQSDPLDFYDSPEAVVEPQPNLAAAIEQRHEQQQESCPKFTYNLFVNSTAYKKHIAVIPDTNILISSLSCVEAMLYKYNQAGLYILDINFPCEYIAYPNNFFSFMAGF